MNKIIINKLKNQIPVLQKLKDGDYDNFINWSNRTKIYILGIWLDKKDENLRKEVINLIEKCIIEYTMHTLDFDSMVHQKTITTKSILKNILETFIEVIELREEDSEIKEKS